MWTQMAKADKGQGVESNQLFFDSESRQVQSDLDSEGNAEQAKALAMQAQLVGVINKLQQRKQDDNGFDHVRNSFGGKGVASGKHTHIPPEVRLRRISSTPFSGNAGDEQTHLLLYEMSV